MNWKLSLPALALLPLAACGPKIRPLQPVLENGEVLEARSDELVAEARAMGEAELDRLRDQRAAGGASALSTCRAEVCDALSRGELALGMNEVQVLAATGTTAQAWTARDEAGVTLLTPRSTLDAPGDAVAPVARVTLVNGRVSSYTYREPQGLRTVASAQDASPGGSAAARADALLRQGDAYAAQGELGRALDLYDRADVLRPDHAETTLRIAQTLDKQLRPVEAVLRYRLFIHQLELERIEARGDAAAKIAEAIARAHERIVVLERR